MSPSPSFATWTPLTVLYISVTPSPTLALDCGRHKCEPTFFSFCHLTVSATCPRETLEAAWLRQMGYTHKKQPPKWSNETAVEYDVPIGSQGRDTCDSMELARPSFTGVP